MIGWIGVAIFAGFASLCFYLAKDKDDDNFGPVGLATIITLSIFLGVSYQYHIVNAEFRYDKYKQIKADLENIIDRNPQIINVKDFEMGKQLSEAIKDLRSFECEIKSCKASPFSVFKPRIEIDN